MIQKKITFDSFIRGILTAMVIIGILYLVNRLSGVLLPFFIAWLIAYLIYPYGHFLSEQIASEEPGNLHIGCFAGIAVHYHFSICRTCTTNH